MARRGARRGDGWAGDVLEWRAKHPQRQAASCQHFGACGGCALQHVPGADYAAIKQAWLLTALRRAGVAAPEPDSAFLVPPGSRRRAVLAARRTKAGVILGLHEARDHAIVDMRACPVLRKEILGILPSLREALTETLPPGGAATVTVNLCDNGVDLLIEEQEAAENKTRRGGRRPGGRNRDRARADTAALLPRVERLAQLVGGGIVSRVSWRAPGRPVDTIAEQDRPIVLGATGMPVATPPGAFLQATAESEAEMMAFAREAARDAGQGPGLDLYCGIGTFAAALSSERQMHAVEAGAEAIAALKAGSDRAMRRVTTEVRDLAKRPVPAEILDGYAVVLFDPPRVGAATQARALAASRVGTIIAVSCNPASFARDARTLADGGYRMTRLRMLDQFLWSHHVECIAVFTRSAG